MIYYGLEWQSFDTYFQMKEVTAPGTPPENELRFYVKDVGGISTLCYKNDAGTEICLPTSGSIISSGDADWIDLTDGGATTLHSHAVGDHGALTGLGDDDHTQYVLRSILTTNGDLFIRSAGVIARLGIGSEDQVLTVVSGAPAWSTVPVDDGNRWSVLTNGDAATPELMWDSNGDVIMLETIGGAA